MKRIICVSAMALVLCAGVFANELGVGYNNGGPSVRFKWDDAITSAMSVMVNYTNDSASERSVTEITLAIAPVNLALYRGELGSVNIGFLFKDRIRYEAGKGLDKTVIFTANDYSLDILLPELELNFPGVQNLKIIGALGIGASWKYGGDGQLDSFGMNLFGIGLANVGLVYYFNLPAEAPAAAVKTEPAKPVKPVQKEVEPPKVTVDEKSMEAEPGQ